MTISEYCEYIERSPAAFHQSRLLVIGDRNEALQLQDFYRINKKESSEILRISDLFTDAGFLPMPNVIFSRLNSKIRQIKQQNKVACVVGLDGYMSLLSLGKISSVYDQLLSLLESNETDAVVLTSSWNQENTPFANPRYIENKSILNLCSSESLRDLKQPLESPGITFVREEWATHIPHSFKSIQTYLRKAENEDLDSEVVIAVKYGNLPWAGVRSDICQVYSLSSYMQVFCEINEELPLSACQWILDKIQSSDGQGNALDCVKSHFFPNGLQNVLRLAPEKLFKAADENEFNVLRWMLKQFIPQDSYLFAVLKNPSCTILNFMVTYACEAIDQKDSKCVIELASERHEALKKIGFEYADSGIRQFIELSLESPIDQVLPWLNNDILCERVELLRRISMMESLEIPREVKENFPLLKNYLAEYQLGYEELNAYFTQYRIRKLKNRVDEEFVQHVGQTVVDSMNQVKSRDSIVQPYVKDCGNVFLVVDALSAEYIPLILSLAKEWGIGIESAAIGSAKLPTCTRFNSIACWPESRRLPEIKVIDNIVHDGMEKHTTKKPEENFVATLQAIQENVLRTVADAIHKYDRVILTADHGASRLAVCAFEQKYTKTLELSKNEKVDDWRYTACQDGTAPPEVLTSFDGMYWVVKGYDRFSKQGGGSYSVHGGATPEEVFVPVIVFKQGAAFVPQITQQNTKSEFIEDDDFDI